LSARHDFWPRPLYVGTHPTVTTCKANTERTLRFLRFTERRWSVGHDGPSDGIQVDQGGTQRVCQRRYEVLHGDRLLERDAGATVTPPSLFGWPRLARLLRRTT
jgi:hypothetical protein